MYQKEQKTILLAKNAEKSICLIPRMANRHGLIAGATGTGKTITLKVMAESFSSMGVPVFLADIKGDLTGMCKPGDCNEHVQKRIDSMALGAFPMQAYPTRFFDVYGKSGHPVRTTISDMGPELLARLMGLSEVQRGILTIIFKIADDKRLLLIDLKDLKAMTRYVGDHAADFKTSYGNVTSQSIGSIQRGLLQLAEIGGDIFFGEPALDIADWMVCDADGRGFLNVLECQELFRSPLLYSTFLLWMLSDLYESLPEAGDLDKPKMVFFFDEAHLLFRDAPKALLEKVEQVVRLIRSKGVGIYFVTQQPSDVPDSVLSQLGNRVQHALRAYTPNDQKGLRAAARSFRENPAFDSEKTLTELGTGEVLLSLLDEEGVPGMVERAKVLPPQSFMGAAEPALVQNAITCSPLYAKYQQTADRESAFENLSKVEAAAQAQAAQVAAAAAQEKAQEAAEKAQAKAEKAARAAAPRKSTRASPVEKAIAATMTSIGRELGHDILRGLFGSRKRR